MALNLHLLELYIKACQIQVSKTPGIAREKLSCKGGPKHAAAAIVESVQ